MLRYGCWDVCWVRNMDVVTGDVDNGLECVT